MSSEISGSIQSSEELEPGDIVVDRDDEGGENRAVVVNVPPVSVTEWSVHSRGTTVAEDNPSYPGDSAVVIVVFLDEASSSLQYYSGAGSIKISFLNDHRISFYAFPRPRLKKCGSRGAFEAAPETIRPSPYHTRTFEPEDNHEFIQAIQQRGHPDPYPLVRITDTEEFVLLNGHRRVWASCISELSQIKIKGCYMTDRQAARIWCQCHLAGYDETEREEAVQLLQDRFGDEYTELIG